MLPQNNPDRIRIVFDDHRLVANAGLLLPATLAQHLGLRELVDRRLDPGGAPGRANTGDKLLTLVASALAGWRHVAVTRRRTMEDFAHQMRWLVDEAYPDTPVVQLVMDNLNAHRPASLYETFPAPEARRIAKRLEFHCTPKHGSWLNMAEIEFSVLSRSCLKQRLSGEEALRREVDALVKERNAARATIQWRFNTQDARTKLHRLYPSDFTVD